MIEASVMKKVRIYIAYRAIFPNNIFSLAVVASNFKTTIKTYGCGFSNNLKLFWPFSYRLEQF